ncbi:hypothetical protein [Natronococcus wangiae]|uniref:hypothetical protein n=1 Tax=Natronococcus wangiae TaxID=3068275 RepID=UPI00273D2BB6|nr:hypothetical protein [Natronococcus sp. AD5]
MVTDFRIDTGDVLVSVPADGSITVQFVANSGCGVEPDIQTLSLPRGHCGFLGTYDGAPGLSLDLHRDDVAETADESIRRDALTTLEVLTAEVWGNRHRVGPG